jgi:hypothetical protein
MKDQQGTFGIVVGALFVAIAIAMVLSGGSFGGKTTIDGDDDLPPVAMGAQPAPSR